MIIWLLCCFGCAILFTIIGIYAYRSKTPMHFYSGTKVSPDEISDIPAYNKANCIMWILYSLWYWIAGLLYFFVPKVAVGILVLGAILGTILLIYCYSRIYKSYSTKTR